MIAEAYIHGKQELTMPAQMPQRPKTGKIKTIMAISRLGLT